MPHQSIDIGAFPGSFAYMSQDTPISGAVVFVHGWNGDAYNTWAGFQTMIDHPNHEDQWSRWDVYFYQYRSVWDHIQAASDRFGEFLKSTIPTPKPGLFEAGLGDLSSAIDLGPQFNEDLKAILAHRKYTEVVLVGHSEGAVVIRNLIADSADRRSARRAAVGSIATDSLVEHGISLDGRLRLFAPALFGYSPARLIGIIVNLPFLSKVVDALLRASPSYQDLHAPSDFLIKLQERTELLAGKFDHSALRASILWGRNEEIVKVRKYEQDVIAAHIEGKGHCDICRPNPEYRVPLDFVANA